MANRNEIVNILKFSSRWNCYESRVNLLSNFFDYYGIQDLSDRLDLEGSAWLTASATCSYFINYGYAETNDGSEVNVFDCFADFVS